MEVTDKEDLGKVVSDAVKDSMANLCGDEDYLPEDGELIHHTITREVTNCVYNIGYRLDPYPNGKSKGELIARIEELEAERDRARNLLHDAAKVKGWVDAILRAEPWEGGEPELGTLKTLKWIKDVGLNAETFLLSTSNVGESGVKP